MSLSEKIFDGRYYDLPDFISIDDVREAVKELKEALKPVNKDNFREDYVREAIPRIINKIFGEKLTK